MEQQACRHDDMFAPFCSGPSRPPEPHRSGDSNRKFPGKICAICCRIFRKKSAFHSKCQAQRVKEKDKIGRDTILCGALGAKAANTANTANIGAFTNSLHPLSPLSAGFLTAQSSRQPPNAKVTPAVAPALEFANFLRLLSLLK